jgi:hypothetical protein
MSLPLNSKDTQRLRILLLGRDSMSGLSHRLLALGTWSVMDSRKSTNPQKAVAPVGNSAKAKLCEFVGFLRGKFTNCQLV